MKKLNCPILFLVLCALATGCYQPKFLDSYNSSMTKTEAPKGHGDPGSFGGIADATGGTVNKSSYATSSTGPDPLQATQEGKNYRFAEPKDSDQATVNQLYLDSSGGKGDRLAPGLNGDSPRDRASSFYLGHSGSFDERGRSTIVDGNGRVLYDSSTGEPGWSRSNYRPPSNKVSPDPVKLNKPSKSQP